jgi:hypothetical protein
VLGLIHSIVYVPLLSWTEDDKGSLGEMTVLAQNDRVDNVLLEIIIALEWRKQKHGSLRAILPVLLSERGDNGQPKPFPFYKLSRLADVVSPRTNARAAQILAKIGVDAKHIAEMRSRSVKQHLDNLLKNQGIRLAAAPAAAEALEECAGRVLAAVVHSINGLQAEPASFRFRSPHGAEVLDWLREAGLMRYNRVFALHGLHSLRTVAAMSDEHVLQVRPIRPLKMQHKSSRT